MGIPKDFLADGTRAATNCFYCEKVFLNEYQHQCGRKELQKKLARDKAKQDAFRDLKRKYVQRRLSGSKQFKQREGGKQKLRHREFDTDKLIRPVDFFNPRPRYF